MVRAAWRHGAEHSGFRAVSAGLLGVALRLEAWALVA